MISVGKKLWYTKPAGEYMCGLPIGTGRLAAMVLGGTPERLALNHEWLWRGINRSRESANSAHLLAEVRELLLAGKYARSPDAAMRPLAAAAAPAARRVRSTRISRQVICVSNWCTERRPHIAASSIWPAVW